MQNLNLVDNLLYRHYQCEQCYLLGSLTMRYLMIPLCMIHKQMLSQLKINKVKLITNNPKKVEHLKKLGVNVTKRIPIKINPNKYNENYLSTKSKKSGHIL